MYSLRPTGPEDGELLYRVYASTRTEELSVVPWSPEQKEYFLRGQFAAQDAHYRSAYDGSSFDILLIDDRPAGRLYVWRASTEIRIIDIALLPDFRGRGIGERVLRDLCAEADRDGKLLSIHVEVNNRARRLYERVGFRVIEPGEPVIYLLMERPPLSQTLPEGEGHPHLE